MRGQGQQVPPRKLDPALPGADQPHDGFEQGGFAHPVAANEAHHLPPMHLQIHVPQDAAFPVAGGETSNPQQGLSGLLAMDACKE